jgi:hypothetical protein
MMEQQKITPQPVPAVSAAYYVAPQREPVVYYGQVLAHSTPVMTYNNGCCRCCYQPRWVGCVTLVPAVVLLVMAMLPFMDIRAPVGWWFALGALWGLTCVRLALLAVESSSGVRCCGGRKLAAVPALGLAVPSASSVLLLLFGAAVILDYRQKCGSEIDLADRILGVAFPFDCDVGGLLSKIFFYAPMFSVALGFTVETAYCAGQRYSRRASSVYSPTPPGSSAYLPSGSQGGGSGRRESLQQQELLLTEVEGGSCWAPAYKYGLAALALGLVGVGLAGLFVTPRLGPRVAPGNCPSFGTVFRPQPMTGTELPNCAWRTFSDGSCVRYPYDYAALGRSTMRDPLLGRQTWSSTGIGDRCDQLLGILSCAPYRCVVAHLHPLTKTPRSTDKNARRPPASFRCQPPPTTVAKTVMESRTMNA